VSLQLGKYFLLFSLLLSGLMPASLSAKDPLLLNDPDFTYSLDSNYFETIEWTGPSFSSPPKTLPNQRRFFFNPNNKKDYWFRLSMTNTNSKVKDWLIVSYFYTIDEIDVFIQDSTGKTEKQYFRDTMTIYQRPVQHKQPVFLISLQPNETKTVYIKIKNESSYEYSFGVFSPFHFSSVYFKEQLLVGLFYGLMLFVLIYSAINYIFFRNKVILIYIIFILCQITHMLFRDGNGLYLLPYYPEYADLIKNLSRASLSISILFYTVFFLKINRKSLAFKFVMLFILARIIVALVMLNTTSIVTFSLEFGAILICTILSIRASIAKDPDANYMTVGFSALCFSYFIFYLSVIGFSAIGDIGFFILYFGLAAESIFTTLALTERFKRIRIDNSRKDQMNRELEQTVAERTELITIQNKLLKEQSNELNQFLYSASHDLKGPLKSIEGLINLAEQDPTANLKQLYDMVREKLQTMDTNIYDLTSVTTIKNKEEKTDLINFHKIYQDTIRKFQSRINPDEITLTIDTNITTIFKSDPYVIGPIFENIIDNAIKFRDPTKKSMLAIKVEQKDQNLHIYFKDNGIGIEEHKIQNIFNMFYRGNELSRNDTGLGLYIVKIAVKKLNGEISLESTFGQGSTFHIVLPYRS
jgi:signal transduction histidine kinase